MPQVAAPETVFLCSCRWHIGGFHCLCPECCSLHLHLSTPCLAPPVASFQCPLRDPQPLQGCLGGGEGGWAFLSPLHAMGVGWESWLTALSLQCCPALAASMDKALPAFTTFSSASCSELQLWGQPSASTHFDQLHHRCHSLDSLSPKMYKLDPQCNCREMGELLRGGPYWKVIR
jgi:hypothetical protein